MLLVFLSEIGRDFFEGLELGRKGRTLCYFFGRRLLDYFSTYARISILQALCIPNIAFVVMPKKRRRLSIFVFLGKRGRDFF